MFLKAVFNEVNSSLFIILAFILSYLRAIVLSWFSDQLLIL